MSKRLSKKQRRPLLIAGVAALVAALAGGTLFAVSAVGEGSPVNDELAEALVIDPLALSLVGSTVDAGAEAGEPGGDQRSVWYSWVAPENGTTYILATTDSAATPAVFTGGPAMGDLVSVATESSDSGLVFSAVVDHEYFIRVATPSATPGIDFIFTLWQPTPGGPDNDQFGNALALGPLMDSEGDLPSTGGTLVAATVEEGEPGGGTGSVWYAWTVPVDDDELKLTFSVASLTLAAYTLPPLPHPSDDPTVVGLPGPQDIKGLVSVGTSTSTITLSGKAGETIYLRVSGAEIPFTLVGDGAKPTPLDTAPPVIACTAPTGWVNAAHRIECTASDADSGLAVAADAAFTLGVLVGEGEATGAGASETREVCDVAGNCVTAGNYTDLKVDDAAPLVQCTPAPTGWSSGDVVLRCTAVDLGDEAAGGTGAGLAAHSSDASFTFTTDLDSGASDAATFLSSRGTSDICDKVGNCTALPNPGITAIDLAAPVLSCAAAPTGWSAENIVVDCTASDVGSGLALDAQSTFTLTTDVAEGAVSDAATTAPLQICDIVGNCAGAPAITSLKVDRAVPVVSCDATPLWSAGRTLTVDCTASDSGSGLAAAGDASFTMVAELPAGDAVAAGAAFAPREVCDAVGNCTDVPLPIGAGLDDEAPIVICEPTPGLWVNTAIEVRCTADDGAGSGLADPSEAAFVLTADIPDGTVDKDVQLPVHPQICDAVGNCTPMPTFETGWIDRKAPSVICEVLVDAATTTYRFDIAVLCTASDEDSGLADADTAAFLLRTSVGAGNKSDNAYTATREVCDTAGNCTTAGPIGPFMIDRQTVPTGDEIALPVITTPGSVSVLSASKTAGEGTRVPFAMPTTTSPIGARAGCSPDPAGVYLLGTTTVRCSARDAAERVVDTSFPVTVTAAPELAPAGPIAAGAAITAGGHGFSNAPISVELDGVKVAEWQASGGTVSGSIAAPAGTSLGGHLLVLRGTDAAAQPRLVIMPFVLGNVVDDDDSGTPGGGGTGGGGTGGGGGGGGGADDTEGGTTPTPTPTIAPTTAPSPGTGTPGTPGAEGTDGPRVPSNQGLTGEELEEVIKEEIDRLTPEVPEGEKEQRPGGGPVLADAEDSDTLWPWIVGGGGVLLLAAGAASFVLWRRSRLG